MVTVDRAAQEDRARRRKTGSARGPTARGARILGAEPAAAIAVGGLSGTGKSTLAAALAPDLVPAPGAVHLRSDLERKTLFGVAETVRLPAEAYSAEASRSVYDLQCRKARLALAAGQSVIVDAVHARPDERSAIEAVASELWRTVPRPVADGGRRRTRRARGGAPQ